jgi:hypothetical protein
LFPLGLSPATMGDWINPDCRKTGGADNKRGSFNAPAEAHKQRVDGE